MSFWPSTHLRGEAFLRALNLIDDDYRRLRGLPKQFQNVALTQARSDVGINQERSAKT
jgi:hypothetical protein